MGKIVRYIGSNCICPKKCSSPKDLILGKEYEVTNEINLGWQINYTLKGVEGSFASLWFIDVDPSKNPYIVFATKLPDVGESFHCYKATINIGAIKMIDCFTSAVNAVYYLGNNIYQIVTRNSIYFCQINNKN